MTPSKEYPVIAWWSGGVRSATVCKLCVEWFGKENVRVIFIDTKNEDDDTYRFKGDCERWMDCTIETLTSDKYDDIEDVWFDYLSLGLAKGAVCSKELKIIVRQQFSKRNKYSYQAFGYDNGEVGRANDMKENNGHLHPIFPLLMMWFSKYDCVKFVQAANTLFFNIELPKSYRLGLENNNCFRTGCVQGGIGYWQWMRDNEPEKFKAMGIREHKITDLKGTPVTICKDQSKNGGLVFLLPHPKYPEMKDISMMKGRPPEMLIECNGFCSNPNEENLEVINNEH